MKKLTYILTSIFILCGDVYAVPPASVTEGAREYDWQTCVDSKTNMCMNTNCITSTDNDCKQNCIDNAKDKCQAQGIPPQQQTFTP